MLPGQISPEQLESVEEGPRTLPLWFSQDWVSIIIYLNPEGWWRRRRRVDGWEWP